MVLKNAVILNEEFEFTKSDIQYSDGIITNIGSDLSDTDCMDLTDMLIVPSLFDLHIHGSVGTDSMIGTYETLNEMSKYLSRNGVGNYLLATTSASYEALKNAVSNISDIINTGVDGASLLGIYLESSYFSKECKGAHSEKYLRKPALNEFENLYSSSGNKIKVVSLAPELDEGFVFLNGIKDKVTVTLAHSCANYETAKSAIESGISNLTHTFNGMLGLHHREPNAVGAALESDITAEVIADGIHLNSAIVKILYKILGKDRMVLISDSIKVAGYSDGTYEIGDEVCYIKNGIARNENGNLFGGTMPLIQGVRNVIKWGIKPEHAFKMASLNPSKVGRADHETGNIKIGKNADLLVLDKEYNIKATIVKGNFVYNIRKQG